MSAAVSEHPPRGPPTQRSLPECREERGKGELCSFSQSDRARLRAESGQHETQDLSNKGKAELSACSR